MLKDPRSAGPRPPFPKQQQSPPGATANVEPVPDHGEQSYRGSERLQGCVAIITGGDSGIGRAIAIAYAREGADVLLSFLPEEEADARDTAQWVEKAGRKAVTAPGDIRDEAHCKAIIERALAELGGVDILVNNAAYQMAQPGGISDITTEQFDRVMKTNVYALFWLTKAAIPHMSQGSSIITTSSVQGFSPSPHLLDYVGLG